MKKEEEPKRLTNFISKLKAITTLDLFDNLRHLVVILFAEGRIVGLYPFHIFYIAVLLLREILISLDNNRFFNLLLNFWLLLIGTFFGEPVLHIFVH
jgi:hypothetical protein